MRGGPALRLLAAAGVLATLSGFTPAAAGAEQGAGPRSVVATGRAQGLRGTYTVPDYVVVSEFFDGGGPVTESVVPPT